MRALGREQRTDDRGQTKMPEVPTSLLFSVRCDLVSAARRKPPRLAPRRLHTHAQVQPDGTAGPASRSRLASRCQRSDARGQMTDHTGPSCSFPGANSRSRFAEDRRKDRLISVLCPLSF
jgi:hypothetical protein